uniref:Pro-resilin n=1 Tax=Lygus hesperus TaxID=30085 RepID=A0A146KXU9_LYGHE
MDWVIVLSCIGLSAAQIPAGTTYLSLVGSPYLQGDPGLHGGRSMGSSLPDEAHLRGPAEGLQNHSSSTGVFGVDGNVQADRQAAYHSSSVPQSRLLNAGRSQAGIPPSLLIPGLSPFNNLASLPNLGASQYNFVVASSQNDQNPSLSANSRSDDQPRLNPHYLGPSLFSQPPQERRSSVPQYQPTTSPSLRVHPSLSLRTFEPSSLISIQPSLNAVPFSRSSSDEYYSTSAESQRPSNQNGYNNQQIITQGTLEPANYQFSYDVNAVEKGRSVQFAHGEQRGDDVAAGVYSVLLPDGLRQVVEYTADEDGYRPRVSYDDVDGRRSSGGDAVHEADVDGSYESTVIAARSQSNGGRRLNGGPRSTSTSRFHPESVQYRLQNRPY